MGLPKRSANTCPSSLEMNSPFGSSIVRCTSYKLRSWDFFVGLFSPPPPPPKKNYVDYLDSPGAGGVKPSVVGTPRRFVRLRLLVVHICLGHLRFYFHRVSLHFFFSKVSPSEEERLYLYRIMCQFLLAVCCFHEARFNETRAT